MWCTCVTCRQKVTTRKIKRRKVRPCPCMRSCQVQKETTPKCGGHVCSPSNKLRVGRPMSMSSWYLVIRESSWSKFQVLKQRSGLPRARGILSADNRNQMNLITSNQSCFHDLTSLLPSTDFLDSMMFIHL